MMNYKIILALTFIVIYSCNDKVNNNQKKDNRLYLRLDTLNVAKLTDTLVIAESTCRGCAVESSTAFAIKDSLEIIKLHTIETQDDNPVGMSGGNINKLLVLVPVKTGYTTIKMYKFWKGAPSAINDSFPFTPYKIEVQN
ncbi:MAG: hypothetical protein RL115_279 [Bacteroidota bacterium]